MLRKYRDLFGEPGTGAHAARIGPFAAVDVGLTVAAAAAVSALAGYSFLLVLLVLVIAGIAMHALFGVDTALNTMLFGAAVK